jgi:CBS domain-containing protein
MIVSDVMTPRIISIAPDATVEQAAQKLLDADISGLLVVDGNGELAGILTEGDLLRRNELGTQQERPWWLRILTSPARQAEEFAHAYGRHVRDVMTADVLTVAHDATLDTVVSTMERGSIKRVPVTRDGRVVGVVSRSDLLRALIRCAPDAAQAAAPSPTDDESIRQAILKALEKQPWAPLTTIKVAVAEGVATLEGTIAAEQERHGIRVIAETTPGVKSVKDLLVYVEPFTGTVVDGPDERD